MLLLFLKPDDEENEVDDDPEEELTDPEYEPLLLLPDPDEEDPLPEFDAELEEGDLGLFLFID